MLTTTIALISIVIIAVQEAFAAGSTVLGRRDHSLVEDGYTAAVGAPSLPAFAASITVSCTIVTQ